MIPSSLSAKLYSPSLFSAIQSKEEKKKKLIETPTKTQNNNKVQTDFDGGDGGKNGCEWSDLCGGDDRS